MNKGLYILEGRIPVKINSLLEWAQWFETADRRVAQDLFKVNNIEIRVSTVFLALDHNFFGGNPLLFETMVFGGDLDQEMTRCSTWEQAEDMHKAMCEKVKRTFINVQNL